MREDFFDAYERLCKAIVRASRPRGFKVAYLFDPESGAKEGYSKELREACGGIASGAVEEFIKEGCRRFFNTRFSIIENYVKETNKAWSKSYRIEIDPEYVSDDYNTLEGSPFGPPDSFYDVDLKDFVLSEPEFSRDLSQLEKRDRYLYLDYEMSSAEVFKELCEALFGSSFLEKSVGNIWRAVSGEIERIISYGNTPENMVAKFMGLWFKNGLYVLSGNGLAPKLVTLCRRDPCLASRDPYYFLFLFGREAALDKVDTFELKNTVSCYPELLPEVNILLTRIFNCYVNNSNLEVKMHFTKFMRLESIRIDTGPNPKGKLSNRLRLCVAARASCKIEPFS